MEVKEMDEDKSQANPSSMVVSAANDLSLASWRLSDIATRIPTGRDFHFYRNFSPFADPITAAAAQSVSALRAAALFVEESYPVDADADDDDCLDSVVNLNDELLERFGAAMDEFHVSRAKQEEKGSAMDVDEDGFQVVSYGKQKKSKRIDEKRDSVLPELKKKVPFHIASIQRPQDAYHFIVNNDNRPFEHVWLENDGGCFVHPLEKLSVSDFIDSSSVEAEHSKPLPLADTSFKLIEEVKDLKELASKLKSVSEFAVDLEHNAYRSFQGLTCLMQISTRSEDYIVDTLKLRIHIGLYLREVFKDPSKRKVMHGADRDILWLQKDFGIYVCNLFDTGQASRVLQLERNSLEYLLKHYCGVNANKEYQNADWRLRPLPEEMVKYAREDTHYLLHIYDLMKMRLISSSTIETDLLLEVYKRSNELCLQLYEKELLTDTSYLHIYGLPEAELNSKQLAVLAGLYSWRDSVARAEDESTGYVLPNKALIEIAKQMPSTAGQLKKLVRLKHPFVERNLSSVVSIIRSSIENSAAFVDAVQQLKNLRKDVSRVQTNEEINPSEAVPNHAEVTTTAASSMDVDVTPTAPTSLISSAGAMWEDVKSVDAASSLAKGSEEMMQSKDVTKASVQRLQRPTAFGALFKKPSAVKNQTPLSGSLNLQTKEKVESIKSSVTLPFHYLSGGDNHQVSDSGKAAAACPEPRNVQEEDYVSTPLENTEDIIQLENGSGGDAAESAEDSPTGQVGERGNVNKTQDEIDDGDEMPASTAELATGFEKCFQSVRERYGQRRHQHHQEQPRVFPDVKPFDYAAARESANAEQPDNNSDDIGPTSRHGRTKQGNKVLGLHLGNIQEEEFQRPIRRQAFPPSGNRSATFR